MRGHHWARIALALTTAAVLVPVLGCLPPPRAGVRVRTPTPVVRPVVRTPAPVRPAYVTATALSPGGAVANGVISYPGHRVRYPVNITYPRTINIYVNGHGVDPTVAIFNGAGGRIGYNDDGGSGLDANLVLTLAPGTYFVEVAAYGSSTGSYTLTVQ